MGNPGPVEDILSDEYEEGEIRDDDILFDNVSSLEEISDREFVEISTTCKDHKSRKQRKKDHKCKENSLCRKERSGKHCYARIRKSDLEVSKSSSNAQQCGSNKSRVGKSSERLATTSKPYSQRRVSGSFRKALADIAKKSSPRRRQPAYYNRKEPVSSLKRISVNRRNKRHVGTSLGDRGYHRKQRSRSSSPIKMKLDSNRAVAKSSLLDRLVGSGSILWKNQNGCDSDDMLSKPNNSCDSGDDASTHAQPEIGRRVENSSFLDNLPQNTHDIVNRTENEERESLMLLKNLNTEDIPIPKSPKSSQPLQEPQKEDIDEVELRVYALKTAIMRKYSVLNRKKNLARLKKSKPVDSNDDSFRELALMDIGDDSSPSPQPPGVEDIVVDFSSDRGSQESPSWGKHSEEGLLNEVFITDMSKVVDRSPSGNKLPCCVGKPIPVISPHRPARDDRGRNPVSVGNVLTVPISTEISAQSNESLGTPKYLKEINSNRKGNVKKKLSKGSAKRQTTARQRTLSVPRRSDLPQDRPAKRTRPEIDEDEDELRKLALMSVKRKNSISEGMLAQVDVNPLTVQTSLADLGNSKESLEKSHPHEETWENLDEDILRAQLLSSLTQKLLAVPEDPIPPESRFFPDSIISKRRLVRKGSIVRKQIVTKKLNKENVYSKRNVNPQAGKPSRNLSKYVNPNFFPSQSINPPVVDKFVIRLSSCESSEEEPTTDHENPLANSNDVSTNSPILSKSDIELKIDRLLETTRKETELIQEASMFYPSYQVPAEILPSAAVEQRIPLGDSCEHTIQEKDEEIFGLTSWQQEEFERQKRARAVKQNLMKVAKRKIKFKNIKEPESQNVKKPDVCKTPVSCSEKSPSCADGHSHKNQIPPTCQLDDNETQLQSEVTHGAPKLDDTIATFQNEVLDETLKTSDSQSISSRSSIPKPAFLDNSESVSEADEIKAILDSLLARVCSNLNPAAIEHPVVADSTENIKNNESITSFESSTNLKIDEGFPSKIERKLTAAHGSQIGSSHSTDPAVPSQSKIIKPNESAETCACEMTQTRLMPKNAAPLQQTALPMKYDNTKPASSNDSSFVQKAINGVAELVDRFEADVAEYKNYRKECVILRKRLILAQQKQARKRKALLEQKKAIETKTQMLQPIVMMDMSSLSPLPDTKDEHKQPKRAGEFIKLKFKEVCLRTHLVAMGLESDQKRLAAPARLAPSGSSPSPKKRMKLKKNVGDVIAPAANTSSSPSLQTLMKPATSSTSIKLVVSVRDKDQMDPEVPLCPYDRHGVCMDEECKYQHLRP